MTKDELLDIIRNAFATKPLPGKIAATSAGDGEGEELDTLLTGKIWTEVSLGDFLAGYTDTPSSAPFFLSQEAYEYFLPLFMTLSLRHFPEDYGITEALLFRCIDNAPPNNISGFNSLMPLDPVRKKVVAQYLDYFSETEKNPTATEALEQYWKQFL